MAVGGTQQFIATGRDAGGNVVTITPTWSVVASGGTINSGSGLFTAGTVTGTFTNTVRATSGAISGFATVVITPGALATITVTPNPATMAVGGTQQFVATGADANGNVVTITPTWSVVASGGSINSGSGLFTAGTVTGTFTNTVKATSGAISGFATVVITPGALATITVAPNPDTTAVGGTQQFVATGGRRQRQRGHDHADLVGGRERRVHQQRLRPVHRGHVDRHVHQHRPGHERRHLGLRHRGHHPGCPGDDHGHPEPGHHGRRRNAAVHRHAAGTPAATWSRSPRPGRWSRAAAPSTAAPACSPRAPSTGTFTNTVKATSGAISGFATVVITPGALATITVTPNPDTTAVGVTQQFVAAGADTNGNVVSITPTWSVVASGGSIDSSSAVFTAGTSTGTFTNTIQATSGAISGFATVTVISAPPPDILGSAGTFSILAGSTVTNAGVTTTIQGDVGVSPGSAVANIPAGQPTDGAIYTGSGPASAAQAALTAAYNTLAGMACGTNLSSQDLGGMTLAPGVYCFNSSAGLTGTLTLDAVGDPNAVFVIQIGSTLTTASTSAVDLIRGADAKNVYWQIGSSGTLGVGTAFKGTMVAQVSITLNAGVSLSGRALARTGAVTMDTSAVTLP